MLYILLICGCSCIDLLLLCLGIFYGWNFGHPLLPSVLVMCARATACINNLLFCSDHLGSCRKKQKCMSLQGIVQKRICCNHTYVAKKMTWRKTKRNDAGGRKHTWAVI